MNFRYAITLLLTVANLSFAEHTIEWQKSLTNFVNNISSTTTFAMMSDQGVATVISHSDFITLTLVVFNEDGTVKYQDTFNGPVPGTLLFTSITESPDQFYLVFSAPNGYEIRRYDLAGGTNVVDILPVVNKHSLRERSSDDASVLYAISADNVLTKYTFNPAPVVLESFIASGIDGSNFIVSWPSMIGIDYQIQRSTNLTNWVNVGMPITGNGDFLNWANALTNSKSFYRVIEE